MADTKTEEAEYVPSTQQTAWEAQLAAEKGEVPEGAEGRDFSGGASEEDLEAFVGVDNEYRNYANESDKPLFAEEGSAEAEMESRHVDHSDQLVVGYSEEYEKAREEHDKAVLEAVEAGAEVPAPPAASMAAPQKTAPAKVAPAKSTPSRSGN
jgi:hypothetical protein